jgi:hypothetical protein
MKKCPKKRLRWFLSSISPHTIKLLNFLLPLILAELIWLLISVYIDIRKDPIYALGYYPPIVEHIMMSLFLVVGGAALFDISLSEIGK